MAQVNWTVQALADVEYIAEYISRHSEYYASLQIKRLVEKTRILETFPLAGAIVPEVNNTNVSELRLGYYSIIYTIVDSERIDILTVHHYRQLLTNNPLFSEE